MDDDLRAIAALVRRQIKCLAWAPGRSADWDGFARDFLPEASLIQSPRPIQPRSVSEFVTRQQGLARGPLSSYGQRLLGLQASVFGNVAVARVACEMSDNGAVVACNVAAVLLVKDADAWKIAGQAWDRASAEHPVPADLVSGEGQRATQSDEEDTRAIEALILRQFRSLTWAPDRAGDWDGFARDFLPGAVMFPSARPLRPQTVPTFVARMQDLARGVLQTFDERLLGSEIRTFGNVAIARAACEMTENGTTVSTNVEALLLIKDGAWRIAAQAWDRASKERPVPGELAGNR